MSRLVLFNFLSHHSSDSIIRLKVLDNIIFLCHIEGSRDVCLNATQLGCIIALRRLQVGFEKKATILYQNKKQKKEGGVAGAINVFESTSRVRARKVAATDTTT